jgi:hypothetical protein
MYRAGLLRAVVEEISFNSDLVEYRSDGVKVAVNQQANIHFSLERGMRIMNEVQVFPYIRESYQHLRGQSLLLMGCRT